MKNWIYLLLCTLITLPSAAKAQPIPPPDGHGDHAAGGELKQGRYVGHLLLDFTNQKLAVTLDTFVVQPNSLREFPVLNAIFKVSLGGFGTQEYITESFNDISYDFNHGNLTLDHPGNDMLITAEVHEMEQTTIMGQVWIRSAAISGQIFLEYQSDEPGGSAGNHDHDGTNTDQDVISFMPMLSGQYEGACGDRHAAFQIQTAKGLAPDNTLNTGLHDYAVMGRLAYDDASLCGTDNTSNGGANWCAIRTYTKGSYNFYSGRLILSNERLSDECEVKAGRLQCRVRMLDETLECDLQKVDTQVKPWQPQTRSFHIRTTADQRSVLPQPEPPRHQDLVADLNGQFIGNLHNESTGQYQIMRLNVIASVSTDNPHNENEIFVSSTAVFHFGQALSRDFWTQQFERRSFYQRPGFTLKGGNSDGFLQIKDWRRGYIKGIWFSHAFGKVGTVELLKGAELPPFPPQANFVKSVIGEFEGPTNRSPATDRFWWVKTIPTNLAPQSEMSTMPFTGEGHLKRGIALPIQFDRGAYDHYAGYFGWISSESAPRIITGRPEQNGDLGLIWPGKSLFGVNISEYKYYSYERLR